MILALHRAAHATLQELARQLAHLGLNASELNVLGCLADGRSRSVGQLVADTATRPTTLTSILDRLAHKGLMVRELDAADRRSFLISLTPEGRQAAATVRRSVRQLEQSALAAVSDTDLAGFQAVTRALTEARL